MNGYCRISTIIFRFAANVCTDARIRSVTLTSRPCYNALRPNWKTTTARYPVNPEGLLRSQRIPSISPISSTSSLFFDSLSVIQLSKAKAIIPNHAQGLTGGGHSAGTLVGFLCNFRGALYRCFRSAACCHLHAEFNTTSFFIARRLRAQCSAASNLAQSSSGLQRLSRLSYQDAVTSSPL